MRKTSVYLSDDEAEGLRRVAATTGMPQAELIRAGIRHIIEQEGGSHRVFHSMGKGHGGGAPYEPWNSDDLYASIMGTP